jgi:hypothetical protein
MPRTFSGRRRPFVDDARVPVLFDGPISFASISSTPVALLTPPGATVYRPGATREESFGGFEPRLGSGSRSNPSAAGPYLFLTIA